jgi:hypothetical protein
MATNIKITALSDITSANMTYNDLLAVVDMNGTPETKKSTVQLAGNLILAGAGGSNFVPAAVATLAGDVTNAAQPNITSVGNLTSANVTGNLDAGNVNATTAVVAAYFSGDGANLTNLPAGTATKITDGTSNVDIPTTDGNVTVGVGGTADVLIITSTGANVTGTLNATGIITGDAGGISNVVYANVTGTPTLGNISTIDIDGSASNVLYGNGVFAAAASPALTGDGYQIANLTGANVVGEVSFAATANAVALANVSGAGNIASIDIDGAAGNVLYGNGVFAAAPGGGSYGDSNVVTLLNAFGSNTITTTGVITGVGSGLSGLAGANVTGEVTNAATANAVAGANVSGEVTFAATANAVAGANVSGTVALATTSGTVSTAAQPNITSLGTLVDLTVTGNIAGANINANTNGFAIGYKEIPPVVLSANDTLALEDSGKHFRSTTAGNITLSIPTNATVAFPTGTAISIVEQAAGNILVNAISGVTLYQAGNSTAGNRVVSTYGVATLMKVDTDTWFISGTGVS